MSHRTIIFGKFCIHLLEESVFYELDLVAGPEKKMRVFSFVDEFESLLCQVFENVFEK